MACRDGTVAWFDWEHSGCRNRLDDVAWLMADEYTPDLGDTDVKLIRRLLPRFVAPDEDPDQAMAYIATYMVLHTCVRLGLIMSSKKDGDWWNPDYVLAGDKVGVIPYMVRWNMARGARWAALLPHTETLVPWFNRLAEQIPDDPPPNTKEP